MQNGMLGDISISALPHTAARSVKRLESLGIFTYLDLLNYFPFRYEDYSHIAPISEVFASKTIDKILKSDEVEKDIYDEVPILSEGTYTIQGYIQKFTDINTRRGFKMQKVLIRDDSGTAELTWFNQKYLRTIMKEGSFVSVSGMLKNVSGRILFQPQEYEVLMDEEAPLKHTGQIIPIYNQTQGISSKTIREKIHYVLHEYEDQFPEILPQTLIQSFNILDDPTLYQNIHFPKDQKMLFKARERAGFDELFVVQLTSHIIKQEWEHEYTDVTVGNKTSKKAVTEFIETLPFQLTGAQKKVIDEILEDLKHTTPMNRLLQGDVGSGKTVVAASAAVAMQKGGYKTLIMAPTEILANQHFEGLKRLLPQTFECALVTRSSKPSKEEVAHADIIIGTHALITSKHDFTDVGLVIVDEQHKFGVVQRAKLKERGIHPHLLSMTATPIPRTVSLTLFGELDISIIDELPKGRKNIKSFVVNQAKRADAYKWIKKEIQTHGTQAFIVCPLIEESEAETMQNVKAANVEFERLQKNEFADVRVGLLHGRLKSADKDAIMQDFARGELDILVSTPVVEVGIDIPNATIICIETAERFGLAQLHQLRGRVGRSDLQSYCLLFSDSTRPETKKRLKMFAKTTDGFTLAEYDLEHRGAGTLFGTAQSGLSDLHIANIMDTPLIEKTRKAVDMFMKENIPVADYPGLAKRLDKYKVKHIAKN